MNDPRLEGLLKPLSARSLIASALLGTHPPALPGRLLVAMAERFGISGGTARVALSRMVDRGELVNDDGVYALSAVLRERQARQDQSRRSPDEWDGTWEQVVVTAVGRSAGDRSRLRRQLATLRLGELREGVWMRPANLAPDRLPATRRAMADQVESLPVAALGTAQGRRLVGELFDLEQWSVTAAALREALLDASDQLHAADDALVSGFNLAAASLRHLLHDPQLPTDLAVEDWPSQGLRTAYAAFESSYQALLRDFFRSVR